MNALLTTLFTCWKGKLFIHLVFIVGALTMTELQSGVFACTKCGSENTQSFRTLHESGIQYGASRSTGTIKGSVFHKTASSETSVHQTAHSKFSAPPQRMTPMSGFSAVALIIAGICVSRGITDPTASFKFLVWSVIAMLGLVVITLPRFRKAQRYNEQLPGLLRRWSKSYFCHRCGNSFLVEEPK